MIDFRKGCFLYLRKQEPEMQQKYEEIKKLQKMTHDAITPSSGEKPKKQIKFALHQKVSEFNPSGQISTDCSSNLYQTSRKRLKTLQRKYQDERTPKQWTSRYFSLENGQLVEGNLRIMKILTRIAQSDYFLVRRNLETELKN